MANTKIPAELLGLNGGDLVLDADGDTKIDAATDDEIHFTVAGNETVYMGVTSYNASDRLVLTNVAGNASATIVAGTSGESSIFMADGTSGNASYRGYVQYQHTNDNMNFGTAGSEAMRIDSSGNVGIGETSPLGNLHVKTADSSGTADSGADELILENSGDTGMTILSGTSNSGSIRFGDSDDNDNGIIIYNHGSSPYMRFFIGGSEVLQLGTSYIYINGGNGQTFSDYVRTYSKYQLINFSSSTSSTSTTLSGYLTYQFMIDCTFHMGYVGNGAISTHIRVSLCNTYSGLSVSTLHTAYGQSHNSYHTFSISGTGNYNTRQLVITCNPQSGQNASNAAGNAYYGMGV